MSPRTQGVVTNTHHGKKHILKTFTHDRMIGGKGEAIELWCFPRKRRFWMRLITQLYLSPLRKTIEVGGFPPWRPKCHTTVVTPTKMECSVMIIIDTGPNKGLLFEVNTGSNLGHPVGFLFCPEFLPPKIHPTTRWLDYKSSHTMAPSHSGFFLFYHYNLQGSCLRTVLQPW